ncbi:hypothetical protein LS77_002495 [Helicobacter bilis]|uniref:Uncharacterized protein n=2 Tax=Helicobacter bilis TaxID=37372 RepID=A0A6D2C807_9HELI|nr:hypothetical protein [Helicobacter bilis]EMZ37745.1 hypothetical protein C826_01825 [Helicobacter bilis WiWa]TLE05047.1 hypothetical protein LS76_006360 [Helicobacter bilis]TLE05799.1 hypothetical protein LS77_002495 [Helicobacter bilis]
MLLAEKLTQLQNQLNTLNTQDNTELYETLYKDLQQVSRQLKSDLERATRHLENKLESEASEYQDITTKWVKRELKDLKPELQQDLEKNANIFLETFKATLKQEVSTKIHEIITQKTDNLHNEIDLNVIIDNLKNTQSLIDSIQENTQNALKENLKEALPHIKEETKTELIQLLQSQIDLNEVIKAALEQQSLNEVLMQELQTKISEFVANNVNAEGLKNELKEAIAGIKNDFLLYINETKFNAENKIQDLNAYIESLKQNILETKQTFINDLDREKEAFREACKIVLLEFDSYIKSHKDSMLQEILERLHNSFDTESLKQEIISIVTQSTTERILLEKDSITEESIKQVALYFVTNLTQEAILNALIANEAVIKRFESLGLELLQEKLSHAVVKDFVALALKEKAKEILKNDELLRAEAEAAAHIAFMRIQSGFTEIQDALDALKQESDIEAELEKLALAKEELEIKKQELESLKQNLEQAKEKAKQDLIQELTQSTISPTLQTHIQKELENVKNEILRDLNNNHNITDLQNLKATLETLIQANTDEINKQTQKLDTFIQDNENALNELQEKIKEVENKATTGRPQGDGIDNKALVWS